MSYKVLMIVDNFTTGDRLSELIPCDELELEIIGIEYNPILGLEQFRLFEPDILILEASIRVLGLERFLNTMRKYKTNFFTILIDDSDIPLTSSEESIKVIKTVEINTGRLFEILRNFTWLLKNVEIRPISAVDSLRIETLNNMFGEGEFSKDKIQCLRNEIDLDFKSEMHIMLFKPSKDLELVQIYEILNRLKVILNRYNGGEAFKMNDGIISIIINEVKETAVQPKEMIYECVLYELKRALAGEMNSYVTLTFSETLTEDGLTETYKSQKELYRYKYFVRECNLLEKRYLYNRQRKVEQSLVDASISNIIEMLTKEDSLALSREIDELYILILKPGMDFESVLNCRISLELIYYTILTIYKIENKADLAPLIIKHETIEDECFAIKELFMSLQKRIKKQTSAVNSLVIQAIIQIISNFDKDISLKWVAEKICITDTYLSRLLKKELNMKFIDYMTFLRIRKAKRIICNSNAKIYEIAERVGFLDYRYFSRVFKGIVGMTPTEYRSMVISEGVV